MKMENKNVGAKKTWASLREIMHGGLAKKMEEGGQKMKMWEGGRRHFPFRPPKGSKIE